MTTPALRPALLVLMLGLAALPAAAQVSRDGVGGRDWYEITRDRGLAPNGSSYELRRDGTYVYHSGRTTGMLTHSGLWSLENRGRTLVLRATSRTEVHNGRVRRVRSTRTLRVPIAPTGGTSIRIDGVEFSG